MNRFEKRGRTVGVRLNDIVGVPTTEAGIGDIDHLQRIGAEYEHMDEEDTKYKDKLPSCVVVYLKDELNGRGGFLKVHIPKYHDDIDVSLMGYIRRETQGLMALMQQQNPMANLVVELEVYNTDDTVIPKMFEKYFAAPCELYWPELQKR